ncbi:MAG: TetR/AcrR family transcriptional regulator [Chloroflexi bacterium]|nr:TetR/AcrR family transcriptional regulator [Chloroflexota bacterium]
MIGERTLSEKAQNTRQRIVDAAINVFARKGFHDAKVDDIVDESGTSKGSVYFHFPNKEEIFLALIDEFAAILEERLTGDISGGSSGIMRVDRAIGGMLDVFGRYRALAKIFLVQAVGLGRAFEEKRMEIEDRFVGIIKQNLDKAVADGDIPPIDTQVAAISWMGAIYAVVTRWVYTGEPEPERIRQTLRLFLLRSIGIPEERIAQLEAADA